MKSVGNIRFDCYHGELTETLTNGWKKLWMSLATDALVVTDTDMAEWGFTGPTDPFRA